MDVRSNIVDTIAETVVTILSFPFSLLFSFLTAPDPHLINI